MKKILILFIFLFSSNLHANNKIVLECFSLNGQYEFKYYGIENDDLFYVNKNRQVKKIPYKNIKISGKTMHAITPENALSFTLGSNFIEVKSTPNTGSAIRYGCSRLNGRSLEEFKNK